MISVKIPVTFFTETETKTKNTKICMKPQKTIYNKSKDQLSFDKGAKDEEGIASSVNVEEAGYP
jgi:hypothetical protein